MTRGITSTKKLPEYRAMLVLSVVVCAAAAGWNVFPAAAGWITAAVVVPPVLLGLSWVVGRERRIRRRFAYNLTAPLKAGDPALYEDVDWQGNYDDGEAYTLAQPVALIGFTGGAW
jgi:hypothetical protein